MGCFNWFMKLFQNESETTADVIQNVQRVENIVRKRAEKLKIEIDQDKENVIIFGAAHLDEATQSVLDMRRHTEDLNLELKKFTELRKMRERLQTMQTSTLTLNTLQSGNEHLKKLNRQTDIDNVTNLKEDIAEDHQETKEIAEAIGKSMCFNETKLTVEDVLQTVEILSNEKQMDQSHVDAQLPCAIESKIEKHESFNNKKTKIKQPLQELA